MSPNTRTGMRCSSFSWWDPYSNLTMFLSYWYRDPKQLFPQYRVNKPFAHHTEGPVSIRSCWYQHSPLPCRIIPNSYRNYPFLSGDTFLRECLSGRHLDFHPSTEDPNECDGPAEGTGNRSHEPEKLRWMTCIIVIIIYHRLSEGTFTYTVENGYWMHYDVTTVKIKDHLVVG